MHSVPDFSITYLLYYFYYSLHVNSPILKKIEGGDLVAVVELIVEPAEVRLVDKEIPVELLHRSVVHQAVVAVEQVMVPIQQHSY